MKIYGYCRVSTKGQLEGNSFENQENEIKELYANAKIIKEQFSGVTTRRPLFEELTKNTLGKDDVLVVTKLDRLARSTLEGIQTINYLLQEGVKIHILNMGLIEDSPIGKLIITNLLAFAEFERSLIIERTAAGKNIARQRIGYVEGRPKKFSKKQLDHAIDLLSKLSYAEVEQITNISRSTLTREVRRRKVIQ